MKHVFTRFIVSSLRHDLQSQIPNLILPHGLFDTCYELIKCDAVPRDVCRELQSRLWWFQKELDPAPLDELEQPAFYKQALCWYRGEAHRFIQQTEQLVTFVTAQGVTVHRFTSSDPGYIVYEDENQVAAVPCQNWRDRVRYKSSDAWDKLGRWIPRISSLFTIIFCLFFRLYL